MLSAVFISCSKREPESIPNMVYIPEGEFIIGSNEVDSNALAKEFGAKHIVFFENEKPLRTINLKGFYLDKFETTNQEYMLFITQANREPPSQLKVGKYKPEKNNHPVININWFDADAYCKSVNKRLPTEEEWEKAARGPEGNKYPWGDKFDKKKGNLDKGDTVPVGSMPEDKSFYGVYDMGGNIMEWTASWYKPYPGSTFQAKDFGEMNRVLKGGYGSVLGHYNMSNLYSRGSFRNYHRPAGKGIDVGVRCAKDEK